MNAKVSMGLMALVLGVAAAPTAMADEAEQLLVIKGHRFEPTEIKVPAGKRVKLVVHNQDTTPEEFESKPLNREKLVPAGAKATLFVGPLKAGRNVATNLPASNPSAAVITS